jgi:hypothetical protein
VSKQNSVFKVVAIGAVLLVAMVTLVLPRVLKSDDPHGRGPGSGLGEDELIPIIRAVDLPKPKQPQQVVNVAPEETHTEDML